MTVSNSLIRIINYIWSKKDVSIAELTEELFLEKSTVSRTLSRLKESNIVVKTGELNPSSQGGRKTNLFTFNYQMASIVGLQIEQDGIGGILTDLSGKVKKKVSIKEKITEKNIVAKIKEAVDKIKSENIAGIGIAIPGILDVKKGEVILSSALKLKNYPLLEILKKELDFPIIIENDSNAGVSYFKLKAKKNIKNIIYFLLSIPYNISDNIGFGVGIIADGKIYHGHSHLEGEYELGKPLISLEKNINIYELPQVLKKKEIKKEIMNFMDFLSIRLSMILSIFDPGLAVIGGNLTTLPKDIIDYLIEKIASNISMKEYRNIKIVATKPKEMVIAKGAASIMLHHFFTTRDGIKCFIKRYLGGNI